MNFHIISFWEYPVDAGEMQVLHGICKGFTFRKLADGLFAAWCSSRLPESAIVYYLFWGQVVEFL
jgi:uncharacterized membrane protein YecN with MAPEG domain